MSEPTPAPPVKPTKSEAVRGPSIASRLGSALGPFLALGIVFTFFAIADNAQKDGGAFLTQRNFLSISVQTATVAVAALGMTLIIIAGGIDLSAGTAIALCATVLAWSLLEDIAVLWTHGDNLHRAERRLKEAKDPHDKLAKEVERDRENLKKDQDRVTQLETELQSWQGLADALNTDSLGVLTAIEIWPGQAAPLEIKSHWLTEVDSERKRLPSSITITNRRLERQQDKLKKSEPKLKTLAETLAEEQEKLETVTEISKTRSRWTPWLAVPLTIFVGGFAGWLNGVLISYLKVVPFIVTLGTLRIFLGVAKKISDETTVRPDKEAQVPTWLSEFLSIRPSALYPKWQSDNQSVNEVLNYIRFPLGIWMLLLMAILLWAVLKYSVFGRYVFALGSNEATVRLCGIKVNRTKISVYMLGGFFIGIAGLYHFSQLSVGNPSSGIGLELEVIAAVVIGGGSLNGGRGSVIGTLTGAAIMAVIISGCTQLGLKNPVQDIILGVIVIAAVILDQVRTSRQTT